MAKAKFDVNVYDECFCGSKKKVKFCCHSIAEDVGKLVEAINKESYRSALQIIEGMEKKPLKSTTGKAWMLSHKSMCLMSLEQYEAARVAGDAALAAHPGYPLAMYQLALLTYVSDGLEAAEPLFRELLRYGEEVEVPLLVKAFSMLGRHFMESGRQLAGMAHLLRAMEIGGRDNALLETLTNMLQSPFVPTLFRYLYALRELPVDVLPADQRNEIHRLNRLAQYADVAQRFEALAENFHRNSDVWWNAGISRAYCGDTSLAIGHLEKAAACESDFERAVDDETLAYELYLESEAPRSDSVEVSYQVRSASKVLTLLDAQPTLIRLPRRQDPNAADMSIDAEEFEILDRPIPTSPPETWTLEMLPIRLGQIEVYDANDKANLSAEMILTQVMRADFEQTLRQQLKSWLGEEIVGEPKLESGEGMAQERQFGTERLFIPGSLPYVHVIRLQRAMEHHTIQDLWPHKPMARLQNKSVLEAAQIPDLKARAAAAFNVFHDFTLRLMSGCEYDWMRQRLGLPPRTMFDLDKEAGVLGSFTSQVMKRIDLGTLSDELLTNFLSDVRTRTPGMQDVEYVALSEALGREAVVQKLGLVDIYSRLSMVCFSQRHYEETLAWVAKGKQACGQDPQHLSDLANLEIIELRTRSANPADTQAEALAQHLLDYFVPKFPKGAMSLITVIAQTGHMQVLERFFQKMRGEATAPESGRVTSSGLWTPDQPTPAAGSETVAAGSGEAGASKIWLPGDA